MQWPLSHLIGPVKHINPEIINTSSNYKCNEQISLPSPWGRGWWSLLWAAHPAQLLLEWNGIMPLSTTKYCFFYHIPGPKLCLNWYLMNCSPYHPYKAGISPTLFIEQEMSCDLSASSGSWVHLGHSWDVPAAGGITWWEQDPEMCSSAAVLSSSFSMQGDVGSLGLQVLFWCRGLTRKWYFDAIICFKQLTQVSLT